MSVSPDVSTAAPDGIDHAAHQASAAASAQATSDAMARMDAHTKRMGEMHENMNRAGTPQVRPMRAASAPGGMSMRHQMMGKRMDMKPSRMRMMMDRMGPPARP